MVIKKSLPKILMTLPNANIDAFGVAQRAVAIYLDRDFIYLKKNQLQLLFSAYEKDPDVAGQYPKDHVVLAYATMFLIKLSDSGFPDPDLISADDDKSLAFLWKKYGTGLLNKDLKFFASNVTDNEQKFQRFEIEKQLDEIVSWYNFEKD
jgi:hypothetical protein